MGYIWKIGRHKVQPNKMNPFYISLEASHGTSISKYYKDTSIHVYHIYQRKFQSFCLLQTSFPILQRQCHPRMGKHYTIRAVLMRKGSRSRDLMMSSPNWLHSWVLLRLRNHRRVHSTPSNNEQYGCSDEYSNSFPVFFSRGRGTYAGDREKKTTIFWDSSSNKNLPT